MLSFRTSITCLLAASLTVACGAYASGTDEVSGLTEAGLVSDGQDAQDGKQAPATDETTSATDDVMPAKVAKVAKVDPALKACGEFIATQTVDTSIAGWKTRLNQPPKFSFDGDSEYFWHLNTNKGEIVVKLWPDVAPMHVSSTIYLTELGFYDGIIFHRVIKGFMAQGGCPLGTGSGGPGYKYAGEFKPGVRHDRPFLLSMANAGPNTDGSQFFLTFVPTPHLDNKHTLFGEIVSGSETMSALEAAGSRSGATREPLSIESASIEVKAKSAG